MLADEINLKLRNRFIVTITAISKLVVTSAHPVWISGSKAVSKDSLFSERLDWHFDFVHPRNDWSVSGKSMHPLAVIPRSGYRYSAGFAGQVDDVEFRFQILQTS